MGQAITPPKVLVVEDDPDVRSLAAVILEESDVEVLEAETAEEALAYMRQYGSEIAAVFADINLPGSMDGVDLARAVHLGWPETMIIATSGSPRDRLEFLPSGARYMQKPWRALDVMIAVERVAALRG
jgi:DNA-binding response OmpR family regulator